MDRKLSGGGDVKSAQEARTGVRIAFWGLREGHIAGAALPESFRQRRKSSLRGTGPTATFACRTSPEKILPVSRVPHFLLEFAPSKKGC
jgi:hypothetical protein